MSAGSMVFVPHVCRIDGDSDLREDLVGACHVDDGWYIVSSCTPVALLGTAVCGVAFWFRLFSSNDIVSICSHEYSAHFLFPSGVVFLGQLRDVAVISLESFGRHCAGGWCFRGFGGLVRAGERCFRDFGGFGKSGRMVFSRFRRSL
jgi:hypothetical protein